MRVPVKSDVCVMSNGVESTIRWEENDGLRVRIRVSVTRRAMSGDVESDGRDVECGVRCLSVLWCRV